MLGHSLLPIMKPFMFSKFISAKSLCLQSVFCLLISSFLTAANNSGGIAANRGISEVEGIPISLHSPLPLTEDVIEVEVARLTYQLKALLEKERLAHQFYDKNNLARVHSVIKALSYGRETPRANVSVYRNKLNRIDPRVLNSDIEYKGIHFWSYADALFALKSGQRVRGLQLNAETGQVERMDRRVASTPKNILVRDWVVLVDEAGFTRDQLRASLNELSKTFDAKMDLTSKQVAFNYFASTGLAVSKRNFNYIEDDQRWFHEGFSRYVACGVLKELLGEEEGTAVWEQLYPLVEMQSISPIDLLSWNEEMTDGTLLRSISYQVFRNVQEKHGDAMIEQWRFTIKLALLRILIF